MLLCVFGASTMSSADVSQIIDGITYSLNASTSNATVTNTPSGSVSIPATIRYNNRSYNVTTVSAVNAGVTSVEIAEGITNINTAFQLKSSLISISVPSSVLRIEENAFMGCPLLSSVILKNGLTYIGTNAFAGCKSLINITIPSTISSMGDHVFFNCQNLKTVYWNAVHCADFTSTTSPFLYYVEGHPEQFLFMSTSGFHGGYQVSYYAYATGNKWTTSVIFGENVEYIPAHLCREMYALLDVTIPNQVNEIGQYAFFGCLYLTNISFGNNLTKINSNAFSLNISLRSLYIPNSVTTIGQAAFSACDALQEITIGTGIISIGGNAFSARNDGGTIHGNLSTINMYALNPPIIDAGVFNYYDDLMAITLNVRSSALSAYQAANVWKDMYVQEMANEKQIYTLNVSSADENKGSTTIGGTFEEDSEVLICASAKEGYQFSQWNDGNLDNPRTVTMTGNLTYVAQFVPKMPTCTLTVSSTNATQGSVLGGGTYEVGSSATLVAIAKAGFRFSQWNDGNTDNPRNIQITGDAMYFANFVQASVETPKYTLSVISTNNTQGTTFGGGEYEEGTSLLIAAFANEGYHFTQWQDGNTDNPRIITTGSSNIFYFANFVQDEVAPALYELNVAPENLAQGWTTEGCTYEIGSQVMIYAYPADGFVFSQWSDGNKDNPRFVTMHGAIDLMAQFEAQTITNINTITPNTSPAQKIIYDGKVYILRGEKVYTLQGQEVK